MVKPVRSAVSRERLQARNAPRAWVRRDRRQVCPARPLQAKRTLREVDINGDGRISKEEFHHMLTGSPVPDSLDQYDARVFLDH